MQPSSNNQILFDTVAPKKAIEEIKEESENSLYHNTFRTRDPSRRNDSNLLRQTGSKLRHANGMSGFNTHNSKELNSFPSNFPQPKNMFSTMGPMSNPTHIKGRRRASLNQPGNQGIAAFQSLSKNNLQFYYQKNMNALKNNLEPQLDPHNLAQFNTDHPNTVQINRVQLENEASGTRNLDAPHEDNFPSGNIHITNRVNNYYISMGDKGMNELSAGKKTISKKFNSGEEDQDVTSVAHDLDKKQNKKSSKFRDSEQSEIVSRKFETKNRSLKTSQVIIRKNQESVPTLQEMAKNQVIF